MSDDKPDKTDEELDELFEENEETQETEEKSDELGSKDDESKELEGLDLEKIQAITGREFKDEEDFKKHYKNLASYVGKKKEDVVETEAKVEDTDLATKFAQLEERVFEKDFLTDTPEAKDSLDLIKSYANDKGISLGEAWEKSGIKEMSEAKKAREEESEIGVKSKNRLNPTESKRVNVLAKKVKEGNVDAEEAFVKEAMGL